MALGHERGPPVWGNTEGLVRVSGGLKATSRSLFITYVTGVPQRCLVFRLTGVSPLQRPRLPVVRVVGVYRGKVLDRKFQPLDHATRDELYAELCGHIHCGLRTHA